MKLEIRAILKGGYVGDWSPVSMMDSPISELLTQREGVDTPTSVIISWRDGNQTEYRRAE